MSISKSFLLLQIQGMIQTIRYLKYYFLCYISNNFCLVMFKTCCLEAALNRRKMKKCMRVLNVQCFSSVIIIYIILLSPWYVSTIFEITVLGNRTLTQSFLKKLLFWPKLTSASKQVINRCLPWIIHLSYTKHGETS